jgi:hypothetical protein
LLERKNPDSEGFRVFCSHIESNGAKQVAFASKLAPQGSALIKLNRTKNHRELARQETINCTAISL